MMLDSENSFGTKRMDLPSGDTANPKLDGLSRLEMRFFCQLRTRRILYMCCRSIEEVNAVTDERPAGPVPAFRLIQNAGFLAAMQWHLPYAWHFRLRIIKRESVRSFGCKNATVSGYLDWGSAIDRYLPSL